MESRVKTLKRLLIFVLMMTFVLPGTSQQKKEFTNPILAGFYPDPSICQAGDDY